MERRNYGLKLEGAEGFDSEGAEGFEGAGGDRKKKVNYTALGSLFISY